MKRLYILCLCMVVSCSLFLNAESSRDAGKVELFNTVYNSAAPIDTSRDLSAQEEDKDRDAEEWASQYLNMRNVVAGYLFISPLVNPFIIGKIFKKEFLEARVINTLPITKSEAICLPIDAVVYIIGNKFLNKNYPIKSLVQQAAVSAARDIRQSLAFAATNHAVTYLPKWSQQPVAIGLKAIYLLGTQKL